MLSLQVLPIVRRLNARTRAAATRRRRLRKAASALCASVAVLVAWGPSSAPGRPSSAQPAAERLAGRHVLSLPTDPTLLDALTDHSMVDVWDEKGRPMATRAPVLPSAQGQGPTRIGDRDRSHVLVGVTPRELSRILSQRAESPTESPQLTVTLAT